MVGGGQNPEDNLPKMVHFAIFSVLTDFGKLGAEPPMEGCPIPPRVLPLTLSSTK